jgi:hypothetical protein
MQSGQDGRVRSTELLRELLGMVERDTVLLAAVVFVRKQPVHVLGDFEPQTAVAVFASERGDLTEDHWREWNTAFKTRLPATVKEVEQRMRVRVRRVR